MCGLHHEAGKTLSLYCCRLTGPSVLQQMGNIDVSARFGQQGIICVHVMGSAVVVRAETVVHQGNANIHDYLAYVSQVTVLDNVANASW